MNKNRLQFVHHNQVFATRDEAIAYVKNSQTIDRPSLYAEPMVLKYGNEAEPNIILAIGSVGDGSIDASNKTFFIDIEGLKEDIVALEDGIAALAASLVFIGKNSDTIEMNVDETESGVVIGGEVKLKETVVINREEVDSIIKKDEDGIYSYVNLVFDDNTNTFTFQVNNSVTEFSIPVIEEATYDPKTESIIFTYTDGKNISVSVDKLIEEWTVEGAPVTPITLHRDRQHGEDEETHKWKDVLWGEVNIAPSGVTSDNILKTTSDNKYLYVDGKASNISYWKNGNKITVKEALDSIETKVSPNENNVITKRYGSSGAEEGIFASVSMSYDEASNKLSLTTSSVDGGNKTTTFQLNAASFIDDISYDSVTEILTIRYVDQNGNIHSIDIKLADIIDEWVVNNDSHTVELVKQHNTPGKDILSADVKIASKTSVPTNILEVSDHMLVVRGEASNIKYSDDETVKGALDRIDAEKSEINDKINEISGNVETISSDLSSLTEQVDKNTDDIAELSGKVEDQGFVVEDTNTVALTKTEDAGVDTLSADVKIAEMTNNTILAAADGIYMTIDYDANTNVIKVSDTSKSGQTSVIREIPLSADTNIVYSGYDQTNEEIVITYKTAAHEVHELKIPTSPFLDEIEVDINELSGKTTDNENDINELLARTAEIETELGNEEATRAAADSALDARITSAETEIANVKSSVSTLQDAVSGEITRATSAETALQSAVTAEQTRATNAETMLGHLIDDETANRTHADEDLSDRIDGKANAADVYTKTEVDEKIGDADVSVASTNTLELNKSNENVISGNVRISTEAGNIINTTNGLYVKVDVEYSAATNTLKFTTTEGSKEIPLGVGTIINDINYDPNTKSLELKYTNAAGQSQTITVPVSDLFDEIGVLENEFPTGVELIKYKDSTDKNRLSATTHIASTSENNILELIPDTEGDVLRNYLYVNGSASNIKMPNGDSVEDALGNVYTKAETDERIEEATGDVHELEGRVGALETSVSGIETALTEVQTALVEKANTADVEAALAEKADTATTYTKTEVDTALAEKADADNVYTKSETSGATEIASALGAIDTAITEHTGNTDIHVTTEDKTKWNKAEENVITAITLNGDEVVVTDKVAAIEVVTEVDDEMDMDSPNPVANSAVTRTIVDNERVTAASLNDLNDRLNNLKTINGESLAGPGNIVIEGGGTVDDALSTTSENPVQNKVITLKINEISGNVNTISGDVETLKTNTGSVSSDISTISGAVTANTAAIATKANASDVYAKGETSGATEIANALDSKFGAVEYDSETKQIYFYSTSTADEPIANIDATNFIKDGMVDNVEISGNNLVITFNEESGKQTISIPLTDIFDPSNYYNKTDVDTALANKADTATTYTKTDVDGLLDDKADASGLTSLEDVVSNNEQVIAAALTDINGRINTISADTGNKLSGVAVMRGTSWHNVEVADGVAHIPVAGNQTFGVVMVDTALDADSINPVANSAITADLNDVKDDVTTNANDISSLKDDLRALTSRVAELKQIITNLTNGFAYTPQS
jgi:predicted  nucleic acid-binding Zn-ribbon protein